MSFQEESTPGDQLIACNSACQGELDSGIVSKRPIDNMEGSDVEVRVEEQQGQWECLETSLLTRSPRRGRKLFQRSKENLVKLILSSPADRPKTKG